MKKLSTWVLVVYTILTVRLLLPFIFNGDATVFAVAFGKSGDGGLAFLGLFVGAFLNAFLILYWISRKQNEGAKI